MAPSSTSNKRNKSTVEKDPKPTDQSIGPEDHVPANEAPDESGGSAESEHSGDSQVSTSVASSDISSDSQLKSIYNLVLTQISEFLPMGKRDSYLFFLNTLKEVNLPSFSAAYLPGREYSTIYNRQLNLDTVAHLKAKLHPNVRDEFARIHKYEEFVARIESLAAAHPLLTRCVGNFNLWHVTKTDSETPTNYLERLLSHYEQIRSINHMFVAQYLNCLIAQGYYDRLSIQESNSTPSVNALLEEMEIADPTCVSPKVANLLRIISSPLPTSVKPTTGPRQRPTHKGGNKGNGAPHNTGSKFNNNSSSSNAQTQNNKNTKNVKNTKNNNFNKGAAQSQASNEQEETAEYFCSFQVVTRDGIFNSTSDWIIDQGAEANFTGNFANVIDPVPFKGKAEGYFGEGTITHVGKCRFVFQSIDPTKPPLDTLVPVYYAPNAPKNLLSPQVLYKAGFYLYFIHTDVCEYHISDGSNFYRLCTAIREDEQGRLLYLYRSTDRFPSDEPPQHVHNNLQPETAVMSANATMVKDPMSAAWIHALFGHQGFERCKDLLNTIYPGQSISKFKLIDCEACKVCKIATKPYHESTTTTATRRCERLRIDLSGRIPTSSACDIHISFDNYTCFLLVKDEYTHFLWFKPIRVKTAKNVTDALVELLAYLKNKFPGDRVCHIVSDCGSEFVNSYLEGYTKERGILFETVPPGESPSNGMIEREMRSVKESGDALLTAAGLHKGFWPEAYAHSTHLHNFMRRYRRKSYHPRAPPNADGTTSESYFYPYLALYHVDTPEQRAWHDNSVRHHFANISIFGQSGQYKDPNEGRGMDSSVSTRTEPAIYLGVASDHFSSYLTVFLPHRGLIRKASTSTFIPSCSRLFDYSRIYSNILFQTKDILDTRTLVRLIPIWKVHFKQYLDQQMDLAVQSLNFNDTDSAPTDSVTHQDESSIRATIQDIEELQQSTDLEPTVNVDTVDDSILDGDTAPAADTPESHRSSLNDPNAQRSSPVPTESTPVTHSENSIVPATSSTKPRRSHRRSNRANLGKIVEEIEGPKRSYNRRPKMTSSEEVNKTQDNVAQVNLARQSFDCTRAQTKSPESIAAAHFLNADQNLHSISTNVAILKTDSSPQAITALSTNLNLETEPKLVIPQTHKHAMASPESDKWTEAELHEISQLHRLEVWEPTPYQTPPKEPVECRQVYDIKPAKGGEGIRFKARLVAKGFTQEYGKDFFETYSEVADINVVRLLLALAHHRGYHVNYADVTTAFLYSPLDEEIYIVQPPGYSDGTSGVLKLNKALYGLKQAPLMWFKELSSTLIDVLGFDKVNDTNSLFVKRHNEMLCFIVVYVDDILIISSDFSITEGVLTALQDKYEITDLGYPDRYLSLSIKQNPSAPDTLFLRSTKTIDALLETFSEEILHAVPHIKSICPLTKDQCAQATTIEFALEQGRDLKDLPTNLQKVFPELDAKQHRKYQSGVGSLLFISSRTRLDLSHAVSQLSRYTHAPRVIHWRMLIRTLVYVYHTRDEPLLFPRDPNPKLVGFCDASYGSDQQRFPSSGYVIRLGGCPVMWIAQRIRHSVTSIGEAELRTVVDAIRAQLWLKHILIQIGEMDIEDTSYLCTDSQSSSQTMNNIQLSAKTARFNMLLDVRKESIRSYSLKVVSVRGKANHADGLTKALSGSDAIVSRDRLLKNSDPYVPDNLNKGEI